jgi:hypothetical protein
VMRYYVHRGGLRAAAVVFLAVVSLFAWGSSHASAQGAYYHYQNLETGKCLAIGSRNPSPVFQKTCAPGRTET